MPRNILYYTPADENAGTTTAYGHVFTAGEKLDLGEDIAGFDRLKANPEFSLEGKPKRLNLRSADEPEPAPDASGDESNDGKDAKTRAATQAKALKAAKAEANKASA